MKKAYLLLIFVFVQLLFATGPLFAQQNMEEPPPESNFEYQEDDGDTMWEQGGFRDDTGIEEDEAEFESGGGQYIGEQEAKAREEEALAAGVPAANQAEQFEKDLKVLDQNILYGVLTGITLGGTYAMIKNATDGSTARENAQYLGGGAVLGLLLGMTIGTKSLYTSPPPQYGSLEKNAFPSHAYGDYRATAAKNKIGLKTTLLGLQFSF